MARLNRIHCYDEKDRGAEEIEVDRENGAGRTNKMAVTENTSTAYTHHKITAPFEKEKKGGE